MKRLGYLAALAALLAFALGCGSSAHRGPQAGSARADPKYHFLPGGILKLAEGRAPNGPAFAISVLRYHFQGTLGTDLQAQMEPHAKRRGGSGNFTPRLREPFEWTTEQGCSRSATWSILYGLLRDPGDSGVLFFGASRRPLRIVPIPARFHLRGALGYAALTRNPTRVLVRDGAGQVVQNEQLGRGPIEHCNPGESSGLLVLRKKG